MVVADYKFYSGVGNKDLLNTANYLVSVAYINILSVILLFIFLCISQCQ